MTDKIDYLIARVADADPARVAATLRLFVCVSHATVLPQGGVLAILDEPIRDESDGFGVIEAAVRSITGVTNVTKVRIGLVFGGRTHRPLVEAVEAAIVRLEPKVPEDSDAVGEYVRERRAWIRTAKGIYKGLDEIA